MEWKMGMRERKRESERKKERVREREREVGWGKIYDYHSIPLLSRKYLIQALSEEDRKSWLEIMEGKEPVYSSLKVIERKHIQHIYAYKYIHMMCTFFPYIRTCTPT